MKHRAIKPVRSFNRFGTSKIDGTGCDPQGSYRHFVKNDPITNIDVHRDRLFTTRSETSIKIPKGQVPYGTSTHTYKLGLGTDGKL